MQNLVVFIEPTEDASNISAKAAMMYLNRFCIDEESACELTEFHYLKLEEPLNFTLKQKAEVKAISSYLNTSQPKAINSQINNFGKTRTHDLDFDYVSFL